MKPPSRRLLSAPLNIAKPSSKDLLPPYLVTGYFSHSNMLSRSFAVSIVPTNVRGSMNFPNVTMYTMCPLYPCDVSAEALMPAPLKVLHAWKRCHTRLTRDEQATSAFRSPARWRFTDTDICKKCKFIRRMRAHKASSSRYNIWPLSRQWLLGKRADQYTSL